MVNTPKTPQSGQRIAKTIARAGLCSRREAEQWINAGRVAVNGQTITSPALNVGEADVVTVDGNPLPMVTERALWRYHKPAGLVVTHRDEKGRPTVFENLPDGLPHLVSVGRLDINTEGLLLLTNDGELARRLELPTTGWLRRYRVRAFGEVDPDALAALKNGIEIDGIKYGSIEARLDRQQGRNNWLEFGLREGKNREIKIVCAHLGLAVNRLIRLSFGPFRLGDLKKGELDKVSAKVLNEQLGPGKKTRPGKNPKSGKKPHAHHRR